MRVALVHDFHSRSTPSGEDEVVDAEAAALRRAGLDVHVAAVRNDELAQRPFHGIRAAATVATGVGIPPLRLLDGFEPDVIHVHGLFPYLDRRWLRQARTPLVTTMHSYRSMCANGYLYRDGEVCTLCPEGKRWSGVRYGCYRGSRLATLPLAWAGRRGAAGDGLLASADRVLVLSERARSLLVTAGVSAAKLLIDRHFVPDHQVPSVAGGERDGAWLFVGRLTPEKGVDRLVAEWPGDVRLRVIGDGPLREALEAAAAGKRIEIAGPKARVDVLAEMQRSFGLVFPSRWYETFGLVHIEALAAGLPTLAFRPTVVADAVDRDGTGMVATWGRLSEDLREAERSFDGLRRRCQDVFFERYGERAFIARRVRLYEDLVA